MIPRAAAAPMGAVGEECVGHQTARWRLSVVGILCFFVGLLACKLAVPDTASVLEIQHKKCQQVCSHLDSGSLPGEAFYKFTSIGSHVCEVQDHVYLDKLFICMSKFYLIV